jgi:hypothetical protein
MQANIKERLDKTREQIRNWGETRLDEIQNAQQQLAERKDALVNKGTDALEAGKGAVRNAEATVLEATRDLLSRAADGLGERAPFLNRAEEALTDALVALRAGHRATLPIDGYDDLSIKKLLPLLEGLNLTDLRTVLAYEECHKDRKTLKRELDSRIEALGGGDDEPEPGAEPVAEA